MKKQQRADNEQMFILGTHFNYRAVEILLCVYAKPQENPLFKELKLQKYY